MPVEKKLNGKVLIPNKKNIDIIKLIPDTL
jgi:uncharacterized protein YlzI (FlbEa/FlbD family)